MGSAGDLNQEQAQKMYELFNRYGIAIAEHAAVDDPGEELHAPGTSHLAQHHPAALELLHRLKPAGQRGELVFGFPQPV